MLAETAKLIASLELQDKMSAGLRKAAGNVGKFETSTSRLGGHLRSLGGTMAKVGAVAAVGIGAGIAAGVKGGIDSLASLESAVTSVDGAIGQMGLAVTGTEIAAWANEIEASIGAAFDDKDIVAATENIIRYGKVTESNLRPAMEVMTDLAAKTGSVESASELLGKALADPAKAAGKLSRYGIILTKTQQDQLKAMMETNDVSGAQALLLDELAKTTKGAAAASQGPYKRAMAVMADVTEDVQRSLARGFLPVLQELAEWLSEELSDPTTMRSIEEFGKGLADGFRAAVQWAKQLPWGAIRDGLGAAAGFAKTLISAFTSMPSEVQATIIALAGLNKLSGGAVSGIVSELGKGLIRGVLGINAAVVNVNAASLRGLPGGGLPTGGAGAGGAAAGGQAAATAGGLLAPGLATLVAAIATPLIMNVVIPEMFRGRPGSSGPTLETNTNPARASEAVMNSLAQSMVKNYNATIGVGEKVSDARTEIRGGFAVQTSAIKNGFTITQHGGAKSIAELRNGFNVNAQRTAALASTVRSGDERTGSRLGSLNAAVNRTTSTLAAKNFSPKITVPVSVSTSVSVRAVTNQQVTVARYTGGTSTGYTIR